MKTTRRVVQAGFLVLTIVGVFILRGNAERWCPFGGVEALYTYVGEGNLLCSLAISNFYILAAVLLTALLVRRAFCGYACPIGTISEWLGEAGARLKLPQARISARADRVLGLLMYGVLALILYFTWTRGELEFRAADPCYVLISRHGEDITFWAYVVAGLIVLGSVLVLMPFCRWLCPMAAVFHLFSRFGVSRIQRTAEACTGCGQCTTACPMAIPVHAVEQVTAARCLSCHNCLSVCPAGDGGALAWGPPAWLGGRWPQWLAVAVLIVLLAGAVALAYVVPLPSYTHIAPDRGLEAVEPAAVTLHVDGLTCRGRATLLTYFLERDDEFGLAGFLKLEAWPAPEDAQIRILYDAARTTRDAIARALVEPYFDVQAGIWRASPFQIEGYDPYAD